MLGTSDGWVTESDEILAAAIMQEQRDILETDLTRDEMPTAAEQTPSKRRLQRDLRREALTRLEDAARSQQDFEEVIGWWDRLEKNEVRRLSNHEVSRGDIPLEWGISKDGASFPRASNAAMRQAQKGDFLDLLYNCPYEMHELMDDIDISELILQMKDDHKEILFYQAICLYSCARIALLRGQGDRNIRKIRATMLKSLRKKLRERLAEREKKGLPMTNAQRAFLHKNEKTVLDGDSTV